MIKTYVPYEPDQQLLLPAALQKWLPDDHVAYFISDVVDQLDMSKVTTRYERERRGGPPYHPRMMVKVLLYGYCVGVASSRRIAQRLHEDIAFRVLAANNTPDFRTISDFRKDNVDALSGLFVQVLALCQQAGLVKLGHVALDGTKVKANASKHKAMSYQRMKEKAAQLAAEVAELLRQAQAADDEEDRRYGKDKRGDELPEALAFRERRLEKIREAMMEETIDNVGAVPREVSADAGYYSAKAVGELYALGVDPFVAAEQTRHGRVVPPAPRGAHTQPSVSQGPDATEATDQAGSATLRFADANCGAGIRPDQAGPGIPAVPAAGTGEGERRMVADLHRPQPAQTVPLWGQSAQESTGRWASPTHQELCRGSEHGAIRKAIWDWPGQPAKLVVAIHCR